MIARNVLVLMAVIAMAAARREACAGCPYQQDPNSFDAEPLRRALAAAGSNEEVTKVVSVTTQVVAGIKYHVVYEVASGKTCEASWVDAPWVSSSPQDLHMSCRAKRSLLGGFEDVDASEIEKVTAYGEAVANEASNGNRKVIVKVLKAQKQIVHGTIYKVNYIVKTTACKREEIPNEACLNKEVAPREVCESTFFTSPYMIHGRPQYQTMNVECKNLASSFLVLPLLGGFQDVDESELPQVQKMTEIAAKPEFHKIKKSVVDILSAQRQVVNGLMYKVRFIIKTTSCDIDQVVNANDECMQVQGGLQKMCDAQLYLAPYAQVPEVKSLKCQTLWL